MQGLWSRAALSPSSCRCVSCLRTAADGVTSRTTTAASRRRLRIGNAVTALYSSIFAAAVFADGMAKDKRRLELEQKIAAVKEEVKELVNEEHRLLESLSSRKPQTKIYQSLQKRQFSSTARHREIPLVQRYEAAKSIPLVTVNAIDPIADEFDEQLDESGSSNVDEEDPLFDYAENAEKDAEASADIFKWWNTEDILRTKAIQKLALRQLAIQLLLRPVIARNYHGLPIDLATDPSQDRFDTASLLTQLNTIRRRLHRLKVFEDATYSDLVQDIHVQEYIKSRTQRHKLDAELQNDINLYLHGGMGLPELLLRISSNLVSSSDPDRPKAFQLMIVAFTKTRQNDLVDLVLRTIIPNMFEMTTPVIISIFTYFRKSKNLNDFDQFLQMLRGEGGYPINLRAMTLYEKRIVNGMEITVPPQASCNPVIFGTLVAAALRFDQPDRAEAWLQIWRSYGYLDNFSTLCAFLRFYTIRKEWDSGLYTMLRALAFMTSSTAHPEARIERLIVHMVYFCDTCKQDDIAASLIDAAVQSGFEWQAAYRQEDIASAFDPSFQRWRKVAETTDYNSMGRSIMEKCHAFTSSITEKLTKLAATTNDQRVRLELGRTFSRDIFATTHLEGQYRMGGSTADTINVESPTDIPSDEIHPSGISSSSKVEELHVLREEMARLKEVIVKLNAATSKESAPLNNQKPSSQNHRTWGTYFHKSGPEKEG